MSLLSDPHLVARLIALAFLTISASGPQRTKDDDSVGCIDVAVALRLVCALAALYFTVLVGLQLWPYLF